MTYSRAIILAILLHVSVVFAFSIVNSHPSNKMKEVEPIYAKKQTVEMPVETVSDTAVEALLEQWSDEKKQQQLAQERLIAQAENHEKNAQEKNRALKQLNEEVEALKKQLNQQKKAAEEAKNKQKKIEKALNEEKKRHEEAVKKMQVQQEEAISSERALQAQLAEEALQKATEEAIQNALKQMQAQVSKVWIRPVGIPQGLTCEVTVHLTEEGWVKKAQVTRSSGTIAFDRAAEAALVHAAPFSMPQQTQARSALKEFIFVFRPE